RRRGPAAEEPPALAPAEEPEGSGGTGRRRARSAGPGEDAGVSEGAVLTAAEHAAGTAASGNGLGGTVPPQGVPAPGGRRALRDDDEPQ
ncbi:hypothetical protein, partial [Streptomyces scabiei]|uniref:hypothetical protein n=1 Tax=Streptomyces scabiei TaxID=1930 RepID=UPI0038F77EE1